MIYFDLDRLLTPLQRKLERPENLLRVISKSMAEETIGLIKDGFRSESDPYGKPWAPKKRYDGRKVLSGETSRLKSGWHTKRLSVRGFRVAPSVDYAVPHQSPQNGSRPRRAMVPINGRIPRTWRAIYKETALDAIAAVYGSLK